MTHTMTITITAFTLALAALGGCDRYRDDTTEETANTQAIEGSLERSREHVDAAADDFLRPDPMMAPPDPYSPYPGYNVNTPGATADEPFMVPPIGPPPATDTNKAEPSTDTTKANPDKDAFMSSARQRLSALQAEIDRLETRADARAESTKAELRVQRAKLEKNLEALGARTEQAFENARDTFAEGLLELEERVGKAHDAIVDEEDEKPRLQPDM